MALRRNSKRKTQRISCIKTGAVCFLVFSLTWWAKGPIRTKHAPAAGRPLNGHRRAGPASPIQAALHSINKAERTPLEADRWVWNRMWQTTDQGCWEKKPFKDPSNEISSAFELNLTRLSPPGCDEGFHWTPPRCQASRENTVTGSHAADISK